MCGRYSRRAAAEVLYSHFGLDLDGEVSEIRISYNVAPQTYQPVIHLDEKTGDRRFGLKRWGLVPAWAKDAKMAYATINAKAETVATKPAFREALKRRRCLVPADAFYEWTKLDAHAKQPYAIALQSGEPFAFAGLWDRWKNEGTGQELETFTIITTEPNELMAPIHNRMPVIIAPRDYDRWLEPGDQQRPPLDLLRPYGAELMTSWRVGPDVGNVRNNYPELLNRIS